jgi:PKD repeat protein
MKRTSLVAGAVALGLGALLAGCTWFTPLTVDFSVSSTEGYRPMVVAFTPLHNESVTSYAWEFGDGETSSDPAPTHVYRDAGTYSVTLTVEENDGTTCRVVKDDLITVGVLWQKAAPARIYWSDYNTGQIMVGDRTGGEASVLVSDIGVLTGVAVGGGYVYWADAGGGKIMRARLDGTDRITLATGLHRPGSLSLDTAHAALYCVTSPSDYYTVGAFEGSILRVRLDRFQTSVVRTFSANAAYYADEIAVDPETGRLYWTVIENQLVGPVSYDVRSAWSCHERIETADAYGNVVTTFKDGLCRPAGVAVDSVPAFAAERVYWTSWTNGRVLSCKIDGTDTKILADDLEYPTSVAVDRLEGKLYVASEEGIHRMNLDGTGRELIFPGVRTFSIAL